MDEYQMIEAEHHWDTAMARSGIVVTNFDPVECPNTESDYQTAADRTEGYHVSFSDYAVDVRGHRIPDYKSVTIYHPEQYKDFGDFWACLREIQESRS
jgi:hypothetical protein